MENLLKKLVRWFRVRLRFWAIYSEYGYNPWKKPKAVQKRGDGVYIGTREVIPFMNDDAKRTFSHLLLRPGFMLRDYIRRGQHERYLSPITALLVFYSLFTLIVAIIQPQVDKRPFGNEIVESIGNIETALDDAKVENEKRKTLVLTVFRTVTRAIVLTHLDQYPEAVDTPWEASLAAVEGNLRSKGIPMFMGNFLLLWLAMSLLLRKKGVSVSGAAAASAFVLCQFCIFMFLSLLLSFGQSTELGILLMGALLFIDYRQWLGLSNRPACWLTVKTGLVYLAAYALLYLLVGGGLILYAVSKV